MFISCLADQRSRLKFNTRPKYSSNHKYLSNNIQIILSNTLVDDYTFNNIEV